MSHDGPAPLGADSFSWDDAVVDGVMHHLDGEEAPTTGATIRPSEAVPRGLDGGLPTALGVDRREPEQREEAILAHRARIDAARRQGLMATEEALDNPSDLDLTWRR